MWNESKSILLSRLCVAVFMILLAITVALAPWLARLAAEGSSAAGAATWFMATVYSGCVPAALLLLDLFFLLRRIERGEVFVRRNVAGLRRISWYCFAGSAVAAASVLYYVPWAMVAVAAAFMGLIVRVVKNVFSRAVALQEDADFTV